MFNIDDSFRQQVNERYPNEEGVKDEFRIIGKAALEGSDMKDIELQVAQLKTVVVLAERALNALQPQSTFGRVIGVPADVNVPPVTATRNVVRTPSSRSRRTRKKI